MGEPCDDGNLVNGDGCDRSCTLMVCGNGIIDPASSATMANLVDGDGCDPACMMPACGNGIRDIGEACDDGNQINGDACDSNCTLPGCGNGALDPGEQCDDGNLIATDACNASDEFGVSIAPSADASTLAVGANLEDSEATGIGSTGADNFATDAGAVYVFR